MNGSPPPAPRYTPCVTLFDALYAFFQEHEHCGELDAAVETIASG